MAIITKEQLEQASVDAGYLRRFRIGTADETIPTEEGLKPTIAGIVQQALLQASIDTLEGYSFTTGATLIYNNQALLNTANNEYYRWSGSIPVGGFIVPANSTPASSGGVGPGKWLSVGDSSLRTQLTGPNGDKSLGITLPFSGAVVPLVQHDLNVQIVTCSAFGAIGDGTYHPLSEKYVNLAAAQAVYPHATALTQSIDWAALQSAINWSSSSKLPVLCPKDYYVNSTLTVATSGAKLCGQGRTWSFGSAIRTPTDANFILFDIKATCSLSAFKLVGTGDATKTGNTLIVVTDTNAVRLSDMFFENAYRHILLKNTSFYISIDNCDFYGSLYTSFETASATYPGVDLIMSHCRFLSNVGEHVILFNGLGSAVMSDIQASVNQTTKTTLCFNTPAAGFGGCQMVNCVWETDSNIAASAIAAVYINGSSSAKWKSIWFDNCIITGNSIPAVNIFFANGVKFNNCGLSSTSIIGVIYYNNTAIANGVSFANCEWSTGGSNAPIRFGAVANADLTLVNCTYIGSNTFVDLGSTTYASIAFVNVMNCNLGGSSTPIGKTSDSFWPLGQILTRGHQLGGLTKVVVTFTTTAAGAGNATHGVKDGAKRIAMVSAVYPGGSSEAIVVSPNLFIVDGGSVYISGGPASKRLRVTLLFNESVDAGW